jgi:Ku70/Ku80-like protein
VSFNRINRKTGNRVKQQNVDSETGEVVPREDTARGYEVGKGQYLIVEDEEFEAVQVESTRTIEIDQFVPQSLSTSSTAQDAQRERQRSMSAWPEWSGPHKNGDAKRQSVIG